MPQQLCFHSPVYWLYPLHTIAAKRRLMSAIGVCVVSQTSGTYSNQETLDSLHTAHLLSFQSAVQKLGHEVRE